MNKKGVTLMELIIVIIILGALVTIVVPGYFNSIGTSRVQAVENNLRAISAAQSKYDEDHGNYCLNTNVCVDFVTINSNLSLTMASQNDGFVYSCVPAGAVYTCSATNAGGVTVSVDVNGNITCSTGTCP